MIELGYRIQHDPCAHYWWLLSVTGEKFRYTCKAALNYEDKDLIGAVTGRGWSPYGEQPARGWLQRLAGSPEFDLSVASGPDLDNDSFMQVCVAAYRMVAAGLCSAHGRCEFQACLLDGDTVEVVVMGECGLDVALKLFAHIARLPVAATDEMALIFKNVSDRGSKR